MKFEAYFLIPVGIVIVLMLLSGVRVLQSLAMTLHRLSISIAEGFSLNVSVVAFVFCAIRLALDTRKLLAVQNRRYNLKHNAATGAVGAYSPDAYTRTIMEEMRMDRNFWILLFCATLWCFIMRVTCVFCDYWEQIEKAKKEMEERRRKKEEGPIFEEDSRSNRDAKGEKKKDGAEIELVSSNYQKGKGRKKNAEYSSDDGETKQNANNNDENYSQKKQKESNGPFGRRKDKESDDSEILSKTPDKSEIELTKRSKQQRSVAAE